MSFDPDWMHCKSLGIDKPLIGSTLYVLVHYILPGSVDENVAVLWRDIEKIYKELGGKYKNKKNKNASTTRWNKEKWIQVIPYLKNGEKITCGMSNKKTKVCRPLKRINKNTPITIDELLKLHSQADLIKLANKKNKNMSGRVYWKTLKFIKNKSLK